MRNREIRIGDGNVFDSRFRNKYVVYLAFREIIQVFALEILEIRRG